MFEDLDSIFLHHIGNWKKSKRIELKDIYKCNDCDSKLEIEKKSSQYKVRQLNTGEPHNWCDSKHTDPFKHDESNGEQK